jgi:nucleoid-associated protein YgaU
MKHLRCLGVWLATTALAGALGAVDLQALRGPGLDSGQPFADLLTRLCGLVLLGCLGWGWLGATAVVVTALRRPAEPGRLRWVPPGWRRLVLSACGIALTAGVASPALATPGPVRLDPPAAAAGGIVATATSAGHQTALATPTFAAHAAPAIVVSPGDSLWRLAAERLDPAASDAEITITWHRLYRANRALVGADPDHIEPGQRLTPPRGW